MTAQETLQKLQQPTFALIASFYQAPEEIQNIFVDMLSIYEKNPTPDTATLLFDKVMGKETPDEKKEWFKQQAATISDEFKQQIQTKYIQNKNPVPKGVPTSGNLLVGFGCINRSDKDALLDAQAAARILSHWDHPEKISLTDELFGHDKDGRLSEARPHLDKPFATPIQRLEHLSAVWAGFSIMQKPYRQISDKSDGFGTFVPDINSVSPEFRQAAVITLYQVADRLSKNSEKVALQIRQAANESGSETEEKDWSFHQIEKMTKEMLPCLFNWHAPHLNRSRVTPCEDSYTPEERTLVQKMIQKRITQIKTAGSILLSKQRNVQNA